MSNLALLPPTAHCAVADRVEPYGLVAGPPHGACRALALDARGRHVAAGYDRGALFVWDLSVRDAAPARAAVSAHLDGVHAVAWLSPSHLATSGGDGALTVWRLDVTRGTLRTSARAAFACASLDVYERSLLAVVPGAPPRVFTCHLDEADDASDGEFEAGDRVQARFEGGPIYYVGTIESVKPYAVAYDDGDHETSVDASLIRKSWLPDAPKLPAPDGAPQACSTTLEGLDVGAVCDAACFVGDRVFAAKGEECWCGDLRLRLHGKVASVAYASRHVACVCADGAVRILKIDADLTLLHSLRNPVDKVKFSCPSFGAGGEHLVAAAHAGSQVQFYVWEVQSGHCLAQPYDDDKASQDRGPIRALSCFSGGALICTAASNAFQHAVRVWAAPDGFSWRAYAPNFEEVHENVAYAEREDEFDLVDEPPRRTYVQPELRVDVGSRPSLFDEASSSDDEPQPVTFDEPAAPVSAAPLPSPLRVKQASPRKRPAPRRSPSPSTSPSPPTLTFDQTCEMCRRERDGRAGRVAHSDSCPRAQGRKGKGRPKQPQTEAKAPAPVVKALPPPVVLPPEVELVVSPAQALAETRRAEADGWRVEGSEYLGRTVRRTILDAAGRPVSCSDGMIRGWLDAARSDYVDGTGTPAALWHVYLATGALAGDEVDLELYEVADSIVERPVEFKYVYPPKRAGGSWSTCVHVNNPGGGTTATSAGSHKMQAAAARTVDALLLANNKRAVNFPGEEEVTRAVFSEITATGRTSPRGGQRKTPRLSVVTPAPPDTRGDEALTRRLARNAPSPPDHRAETTYDDDSGDDWAAKQKKKAPKKAASVKSPPKAKRTCCGVCEGCTAGDCGKCKYCKDNSSRGGPNTLRRPCVARHCRQLLGAAASESTVVPPPAPPSPASPAIKKKASPLDPRKRAKTQPSVAEAALARAEAVWAGSSTPAARPASLPAPVQGSALKSAQASALALSSARVGRPASQADMAKVAAAVARAQPPAPSPPPPPTPPPTPPPPVYFDVYTADGGTKLFGRVDLSGAEKLTFGRDAPHVDVPLEHASALRHHATIRFEGDVAYLADMKSSHGTYVTPPGGTEERITTARLRDGSVVRFGESTRRYVLRRSEPGVASPPRSAAATSSRLFEIAAKPPPSSSSGEKRQPPIPKKTSRRSGVRPESLAALPPPSLAAPPAGRDWPGESSRGGDRRGGDRRGDDRRGDDRRGDWHGQAPHQDGRRGPPPGSSADFGERLSDRAARFGPEPGPPRFEARLADRAARFGPPPGPPRNGLSSRGRGGSFAGTVTARHCDDVRRDQVDGWSVPRPAPPRRSRSRSRERRR